LGAKPASIGPALNLIIAHQYLGQLVKNQDTSIKNAVFGNVGTLMSFQVGFDDAEYISNQYSEIALPADLVQLPKYNLYTKLLIDGMPSQPFSAATIAPEHGETDLSRREKVIRLSREKYAVKREIVEDKIKRWSEGTSEGTRDKGLGTSENSNDKIGEEDKGLRIKDKVSENSKSEILNPKQIPNSNSQISNSGSEIGNPKSAIPRLAGHVPRLRDTVKNPKSLRPAHIRPPSDRPHVNTLAFKKKFGKPATPKKIPVEK